MSKLNRICLAWMVNMQGLHFAEATALLSKGTPLEKNAKKAVASAKETVDKDGHSGGSYYWTKDQVSVANQIGWEKWADTNAAQSGYGGVGLEFQIRTKD